MNWRPSSPVSTAQRRARMLTRMREFFSKLNVLEVDTPALNRATASDPHIRSCRCDIAGHGERFLQTSPESYMKRMLAAGYPDIYSISRVFRDGEVGSLHQPEFTMVEWYRLGFDLDAIIDETTSLIVASMERSSLRDTRQLEYRDAFAEFAGVDPLTAPTNELAAASGADSSLLASIGGDRDAWLDLLLSTRVAPQFPGDRLTVLRHYPASQAALARICPGDPKVADRFEVFFGSMELANGFVELRDAAEQRLRIDADNARRLGSGMEIVPMDEALLAALEAGLPACAGVAAGLDRILMAALGHSDIRDVLAFAFDADGD